MNIENYIASGVIEAYVMDQLSDKERMEVQAMAKQHPEVERALLETEETMLAFTAKGSIEPPAAAKSKLFTDLGLPLSVDDDQEKAPYVPEAEFTQAKAAQSRSMYTFWAAAASIIAVIGVVMSLYYRGQWLDSESRISTLITQNQTLAQQYNVVKNQADQYANNIEILRKPGLESVEMRGLEISPNAVAMVHWNQESKEVFLNAKKMPSNPTESQYQLWAIVDGQPVDMGTFDVAGDMTSLLKMKSIEKASAFAVTLEPRGGSVNPTMEKMYVIGQI